MPGFDLRVIENVVEYAEQSLRRKQRFLEVIALTIVQRRVQQQLRHADDCVHRGTNLVAHVGKKFGLGAAGRLGELFGRMCLGGSLLDEDFKVLPIVGQRRLRLPLATHP